MTLEHGHTTFKETQEGKWTYTRDMHTSIPFTTLDEAEKHEMAIYGCLGTTDYHSLTRSGRKQIEDHIDPFKDESKH